MQKILISHPNGNENTRAAVYGLFRFGMLYRYITSVAVFKHRWYYRLLNVPVLREFKKRMLKSCIYDHVVTYPFKELGRQIAGKLHMKRLLVPEKGFFSTYKACCYIDAKVAKILRKKHTSLSAVYCYEDSAYDTFKEAKRNNIKCIYDLPIGYWRCMHALLGEEAARNPKWKMTLGGLSDSQVKLETKDQELALADIIYVASSFTKKSLEMFPGKLAPIHVVPYGFPPINTHRTYQHIGHRKIKLLYVGGLSQRKGIAYLFEALEGLEDLFELTIIGAGNIEGCSELRRNLSKWNYLPPQPHDVILNIMSQNDIFVFPSLFEGFGLVITEAMSQGTPVITTDRTCGLDIMTDGKDGWIIKAGSSEQLKEKLLFLSDNRDLIVQAGQEALKTAAQRPWEKYEEELVQSIISEQVR